MQFYQDANKYYISESRESGALSNGVILFHLQWTETFEQIIHCIFLFSGSKKLNPYGLLFWVVVVTQTDRFSTVMAYYMQKDGAI